MRLQDLDRVEVPARPPRHSLRSGSLGGTIRFVLNAPDPSARCQGGSRLEQNRHTHTTNEDIRGMINLPLSDTLALRINAAPATMRLHQSDQL